MAKNLARVVDKFKTRVSQSAGEYSAGVAEPSKPWLDSYVKAGPKMVAETQAALAENRHIKGAQRAGDAKWKARSADVGASRYAGAAGIAGDAYAAVAADVLSAGDQAAKAASALPDTTFEQRLQRMTASATAIRNYWRAKKGVGAK